MENGNGHVPVNGEAQNGAVNGTANGNGHVHRKPKAVIVGGGIAGLMLANCFNKAGMDYIILERAETSNRAYGSNVVLVPNGLRIFDQLGLYEKIKSVSTDAIENHFWERKGDALRQWAAVTATPGLTIEGRWGYAQCNIHRKDLLITLWEQVDDDHIMTGVKVTSIREEKDRIVAICQDGSEYSGDFIVGADGAWSHTRHALYRNIEVENSQLMTEHDKAGLQCQYHAIFGYTKPIEGLEIDNVFHWINGKDYMLNTIIANSEDVLSPHKGWTLGEMAANADAIVKVNLEEKCFDRWTYGRTILIGDAAHKMSPFIGQGANQAIEDCVVLTNILYNTTQNKKESLTKKDYEEAFNTFVDVRHARAKWIVGQAHTSGKIFTWPNAFWRLTCKAVYSLPYVMNLALQDKLYGVRPTLKFLPPPVAIVTGSSRGLGAAIAKVLASKGAKVVVNYANSAKKAEEVVASIKDNGGEAVAVGADLGSEDGSQKLVDESVKAFGKIDIIVNNGAIWKYENLGEIKASTFDKFFAVNVRGPLLLVQASLPYLQDNGRIINISSIAARAGHPASSVYGGTKAAPEAMSRAWASELGPKHNITSNCVGVGPVLTEMIAEELQLATAMTTNAPLLRVADTSDITDIVSFLASEQSHWVTGDIRSLNRSSALSALRLTPAFTFAQNSSIGFRK
ncbi:hypothetical protein BZG36_05568, partial [Bifiguratus adelaidae]